jgi:hypothetical protein
VTSGLLTRSAPAAPRPLFASLSLRLRVRLRAAALEGQLAAGADPIEREDLARCGDLLTRPSERVRLARALRRVVRNADDPRFALTSAVPVNRVEVRRARDAIEALARALTGPRAGVRGVAMTACRLRDGCGPLYAASPPGSLEAAVGRALHALHDSP